MFFERVGRPFAGVKAKRISFIGQAATTVRSAVALLFLAASIGAQQPLPRACETVISCITQARQVADPSNGVTAEEQAVAQRLQALGPDAIPPVLDLLRDQNADVRELAGYILRDMPGLGPKHLPALERAVEAGDGWLPPAIASIGTPEAIRFLIVELKKNPEPHTQLTAAFERLGPAAFPELLELFRCAASCDESLLRVVGFIFSEVSDRASATVDPLASLAADHAAPVTARRYAIRALGGLRATARPAVRSLGEIANGRPVELQAEARKALVAIGGPGTKQALDSSLDGAVDKRLALRDIAALGESGRQAGPTVLTLLSSRDPEIRVAAARTLGFIGFAQAAPSLTAALGDPDDWRLVYVAAEALGRLRAVEAHQALKATATGHWYYPVRDAAGKALRALDSRAADSNESQRSRFALEFFDYEHAGRDYEPCADRSRFPPAPPRREVLDPAAQPALAERLAYDREIRSFDEKGEHVRRRRTVPKVGLRVGDGWLVGVDQGEWGGELMFKSDARTTTKVLDENIRGLHLLTDGRIVAVTGLAHLTMNNGALYRIECRATKGCSASRWKQLPGAPRSSWLTEGGDLLVNTMGGSVLVATDGTLRMAQCHSPAQIKDGAASRPRPSGLKKAPFSVSRAGPASEPRVNPTDFAEVL